MGWRRRGSQVVVLLLRRVDGGCGCGPSIVCLRRVVVELVRRATDCSFVSCGGGGIMPARIASFTEEYVFIVAVILVTAIR